MAELERLAFVPAGVATFEGRLGPRIACANEVPLLADRFEVPRGAWRPFVVGLGTPIDPEYRARSAAWGEDTDAWPASWMTRDEARAYAASRGMRLPSAREWLWIAAGSRAQPFPWGQSRASRVANTAELQLGRPVAVGTFELGQTPFSTYDMSGNVWEWVDDPLPKPAGREGDAQPLAWVMGGSYATPLARTWDTDDDGRVVFSHLDLDPRTRSEDIGFRCVAPAREYLKSHAQEWGANDLARTRLLALGAKWGRDALGVLEELAAEPNAPPSFRWLLAGARR